MGTNKMDQDSAFRKVTFKGQKQGKSLKLPSLSGGDKNLQTMKQDQKDGGGVGAELSCRRCPGKPAWIKSHFYGHWGRKTVSPAGRCSEAGHTGKGSLERTGLACPVPWAESQPVPRRRERGGEDGRRQEKRRLGLHSGYFWADGTWNDKVLEGEDHELGLWAPPLILWAGSRWDICPPVGLGLELAQGGAGSCSFFDGSTWSPADESLDARSRLPHLSKGDLQLKPSQLVRLLARRVQRIPAPQSRAVLLSLTGPEVCLKHTT